MNLKYSFLPGLVRFARVIAYCFFYQGCKSFVTNFIAIALIEIGVKGRSMPKKPLEFPIDSRFDFEFLQIFEFFNKEGKEFVNFCL